jgi:hypothetical protein
MNLNLPIIEQVANCKNLLIAGMGGGFDLFCGLPIYFELQKRGQTVHLANFSFSDVVGFSGGTRLTPTLVGVDADYDRFAIYFPEVYLAKWFKETRNEDVTIWTFEKTGTRPLLKNYQTLIEHLEIDGILLIDGGVDSLVRGDEEETATLIEDAISLHVVNELNEIPVRLLGCIGFGVERHLTYAQILENIADLTKAGGYLGSCSLIPQMPAYQLYEEAVLYVQGQPTQDSSVINSSIISSVRGEYGNHHLTKKTRGSRLKISPLMGQYWFFELSAVAEQNLYLPQIRDTHTFIETVHIYLAVSSALGPRKNNHTFHL